MKDDNFTHAIMTFKVATTNGIPYRSLYRVRSITTMYVCTPYYLLPDSLTPRLRLLVAECSLLRGRRSDGGLAVSTFLAGLELIKVAFCFDHLIQLLLVFFSIAFFLGCSPCPVLRDP